jgi:hypothetical protein
VKTKYNYLIYFCIIIVSRYNSEVLKGDSMDSNDEILCSAKIRIGPYGMIWVDLDSNCSLENARKINDFVTRREKTVAWKFPLLVSKIANK